MKMLKKTAAVCAGIVAAATLTGCGGFSGSHSVSPATFLIPGLVGQTDAADPSAPSVPVAPPDLTVASVR